ncbi:MAG: helix-turn-helix transcriptional regulator [Paracoccaceae bacterium]
MDPARHPADAAERPVVGQAWDDPGPRRIERHAHRRGQVVYVERGCAGVETDDALFVVPPHRAVWVPPETAHAVRYPREVAFRGVFFAPALCAALPRHTAVLQIDPLARELIRAVASTPWNHAEDGPEARLARVLLDRLVVAPHAALRLPEPRDPAVRRVSEALARAPGDDRPLGHWAREVALSERTLARRFERDLAMSFTEWRRQLRLVSALERLAAGDAVTTVAYDLGYTAPGSFTTMFRKAMGAAPSEWLAAVSRTAARPARPRRRPTRPSRP